MNVITRRKFSSRYSAALRIRTGQGAPDIAEKASALGELAAPIGLQPLGLARIHEEALSGLVEIRGPEAFGKEIPNRVSEFLAAAMRKVDQKRRSDAGASGALIQMNRMLAMRTLELAESRKKSKRGIMERKEAEASLEATESHSSMLLREARDLESKLQNMARRIISAHEGERKNRSLVLGAEIAQPLLGIHVHLLALDREISVCGSKLKREFAKAQRMLNLSVGAINRLEREFEIK